MNVVDKIDLTNNTFTDLNQYCKLYESYFYSSALNILIYMFSVIEQVSHFSDDIRIVSSSIIAYIGNIYQYAIGFGITFTVITTIVAMNMFGDFNVYYYKDAKFMILKIFGMFFRGSADNVDYDYSLDRYKITENSKLNEFQWYKHYTNFIYLKI
jgi:hypothetical protein